MGGSFRHLNIYNFDGDVNGICAMEFSPYVERIREEDHGYLSKIVNSARDIGMEFLSVLTAISTKSRVSFKHFLNKWQ